MASPKRDASTVRLSRENWIDGAIAFLHNNNVDAIRLDALADQLGVTKGSFYWHFASREELLTAIVETWRERMVNHILDWLKTASGTPAQQLKQLFRLAISPRDDVPGGPLELALRDWARRDPEVDRIVSKVDAERLGILESLYQRIGLKGEQAKAYALLHITYAAGARSMLFTADPDEIQRRRRIGERYLIPDGED
jgi:AcrR family transcriptional regulator